MKRFKMGHPLDEEEGVLDKGHTKKLRKLGVTTVEELHDLVGQSLLPGAEFKVSEFLQGTDVGELHRKLSGILGSAQGKSATPYAEFVQRAAAAGKPVRPKGTKAFAFDPRSSGFVVRRATGALPPSHRFLTETGGLLPAPAAASSTSVLKADLRRHFPPVRDQGDRGTCVAHAAVALMEYYWKMLRKKREDLSEQFLYWNCKRQDNAPQEEGTYQRIAIALLVAEGVCREKTWTYNTVPDPDNEGQGPPPDRIRARDEALKFRPSQGTARDPRSAQVIRVLLDQAVPVSVSVPVFPSWWGQTPHLYGEIPMPRPGEAPEGGHAVCLVGYGYDSDFAGAGFFIVRNSWGRAWGAKGPFGSGHGTIPFAYVDRHNWESFHVA